jgi:lysophospholipase L1-like esterase
MSKETTFNGIHRRSFCKATVTTAVLGSLTGVANAAARGKASLIKKGSVVLFQGDSITDAGRSRVDAAKANNHKAIGRGYSWVAAANMLTELPDHDLKIFNRGISGHKVHQLAGRWEKDCFSLKPDVLSILIGVNDIWHHLNGNYEGTVATYEADYRKLLKRTINFLPDVKLVICEPFVLRCGAVTEKWFPEFDKFRVAAKKISNEFKTHFVPFQSVFDQATTIAPPEHWAKDGVHPSSNGAALMAHFWLKSVLGS